jgi:hypothetical protein
MPTHDFGRALPPTLSVPRAEARDLSFRVTIPFSARASALWSDQSKLKEPVQVGSCLLSGPSGVNRAPERWIQSERKEELAPANLIPRGVKPKPRDPRSPLTYSPSVGYETDMSSNDFPGAGLKTQTDKSRKAPEFRGAPPEVIRPQVKTRSPLEYPAVVGRSAALAVTEVINGRSGNRPPGFDPRQMRVPQTPGPPGGIYPPVGAPFSYCPPAKEPGLEESGPCYRALEWSRKQGPEAPRQGYGPEDDFVQFESEVECRSTRSSRTSCSLPPGYVFD